MKERWEMKEVGAEGKEEDGKGGGTMMK